MFVFELAVKVLGLGLRQYFSSYWNRLDFFIVVMALVDMIAEAVIIRDLDSDGSGGFNIGVSISLLRLLRYEPRGETDLPFRAQTRARNCPPSQIEPSFPHHAPNHASLTRLLRILRLSRMITQLKGVVRLMETLMQTVPKLVNIALLLVLVMYIFAILGMNLYGGSVDTEVRRNFCVLNLTFVKDNFDFNIQILFMIIHPTLCAGASHLRRVQRARQLQILSHVSAYSFPHVDGRELERDNARRHGCRAQVGQSFQPHLPLWAPRPLSCVLTH